MSNANLIESTLDALDVLDSGLCSQDQVLTALEFVKRLGEVQRELKERVNKAAIKYIQANGDIQDGTRRFFVGPNKTTKCLDLRKTVEAVLTAAGGDIDALVDVLSTDAFKPGATKKLIKDKAKDLFETKETNKLELEQAKPEMKLQEVDSRFAS